MGRGVSGGTGIGAGLAEAIRMLDRNGLTAPRQVVDVSGDGRETPPRENVVLMPMAAPWRGRSASPSTGSPSSTRTISVLEKWYRDNVITGPGSFVITATDYEDFAHAIKAKLLREIEHNPRAKP